MAKSPNTKGFSFRRNLSGLEHPATLDLILAPSTTFTFGDAVRLNSDGLLVPVANGESILGILKSVVTQKGVPANYDRAAGTDGATFTGDDTVATSSTNASDATRRLKGRVILDPAGTNLFVNKTNDVLAQTNVGQCFDTTSTGDQIDVATATDGTAQFQLLALDPDGDGDTTKGLFRIVEGQY